ncbi:hypothetical protein J4E00_09960 [Siccationidurans soli]|uniref:Uncharacterized protein n=2 Tax=Hymenobacter negativus TaxID=2795026 RepID=A0ABS3QDR5_9BACT|nr:hypothetical protein [Hymenobacter negativus]
MYPGQVSAYFVGREILQQILNQPGCMGIRFYYGINSGVPQLVAVGADSKENDLLGDGFIVADDFPADPPHASQHNILNS